MFRNYVKAVEADIHAWRYAMNGDASIKLRLARSGIRMGYLDHVVALKPMRPGESKLYSGY
ncbi:hypothetical protein D3C86_1890330 [compost metagenome]